MSARRRWLVRLAPWIGLLAACSTPHEAVDCSLGPEGCPDPIPQYEQNVEHDVESECVPGENAEGVTVASGSEVDSALDRSCLDTLPDVDQVPAASVLDALRGARVDYASASPAKGPDSDPFTDQILVTCTYDIDSALPAEAPATCTGTTTWTLAATLRPNAAGIVPGSLQLSARRLSTGSEPETSFGATVTFSCGEWSEPPNQPVPVPVDAGFRRVGSLPNESVDCTVAVTLDSSARAAGRTIHQLLVTARSSRRVACSADTDCAAGDRCSSSNLQCTSGLANAVCQSSHDAETGLGDCGQEAPFCTPLGRCSTGETGRACGSNENNGSDLFCAEGFACTGVGIFPTCQPIAP